MTEYRPIDCALHSEYELAVMRGERVTLRWRDDDGRVRQARVRPVDLLTRRGEEFLRVRDHEDRTLDIRLDHVRSLSPDS